MQNPQKELYDILLSKDFDVDTLNNTGKSVTDINDASIFSFDFTPQGNDYGTVVVLLGTKNNFEIYFGDNIGKGLKRDAKNLWYDLLYQLRMFAKRNMLSFTLKNINKLKHTMRGLAAINEGLFEGWSGTSKSSYNKNKDKTKLIIRHSKRIGEGDQRFRNIDSIFIENKAGERFKVPFNNIAGARAMARHVAEGGTPYDIFGCHIAETVSNVNAITKFLRVRNIKESSVNNKIVEVCKHYKKKFKEDIKQISGVRGYKKYTESWTPATIEKSDQLIEKISEHLIPEDNNDSRITNVLHVIANLVNEHRVQKSTITTESKNIMKEIAMFESWAYNITEGTWAIPDSPEAIQKLKEILKQKLPVGVDATNATEVLYDIIGDDDFFDALGETAATDPTADARIDIISWLAQAGKQYTGMENILHDVGAYDIKDLNIDALIA